VDSEPVVIMLERGADTWTPHSAIRLEVIGQRIEGIVDYVHCPWLVPAADSVTLAPS
jgi:hypothetical protein